MNLGKGDSISHTRINTVPYLEAVIIEKGLAPFYSA